MQELINLAGKVRGNLVSRRGIYRVDQVGGPHQFWQTTSSRDKERFMLKFYDQQFPSHNKSARCAKARPAVSTMRKPPGAASTQAWRTEIMKYNSNCVWSVSGSVRSTYTQDGAVLLDVKKGACYSMNVVAARVWTAMEGRQEGITIDDIVNALEEHFQVPRERLESDTAECLENLRRLGLVSQNDKKLSASASSGGA